MLVGRLVIDDHLLLRDFSPYMIISVIVCCCNRNHGNVRDFGRYDSCVLVGLWSCRVTGFWALWDNFMDVCYNRCYGNAVKGFCALWVNTGCP
jgi:hypothetical protein